MHVIFIMSVYEKQRNILIFREFVFFTKIKKLAFSENHPVVLKMVFDGQKKLQRPMYSKVMANKRMSRMTVFVRSININQIRFLYFRFVRQNF